MTLRILMAEDSAIFAQALGDLIHQQTDFELIAIANNGEDAITLCHELRPDIVLMDIQMPKMDGLQATEAIMAKCPTPILVITSDPFHRGVDMSFRALNAGALDLIAKPTSLPISTQDRRTFLQKIKLLADIPVVRHVRGNRAKQKKPSTVYKNTQRSPKQMYLGIAASTGGPKALAKLFEHLPVELNMSIFIVQHITNGFCEHLANWLDSHSAWHFSVAQHGQTPKPGHAYIAPSLRHMTITNNNHIQIRAGAPIQGHLPNADILLESLARHHANHSMGLILSGMGKDGAQGLLAMNQMGCMTFAQDEHSCVVNGMPRCAIELGAVDMILDLEHMAENITRALGARRHG